MAAAAAVVSVWWAKVPPPARHGSLIFHPGANYFQIGRLQVTASGHDRSAKTATTNGRSEVVSGPLLAVRPMTPWRRFRTFVPLTHYGSSDGRRPASTPFPRRREIETCMVPLAADGVFVDKIFGVSVAFDVNGREIGMLARR